MKSIIVAFLIISFINVNAQTVNELTVKINRGEKNLFFPTSQSEKVINFELTGINSSELPQLVEKARQFEGVIGFSTENTSNPLVFKAVGTFLSNNQYDYFKDFFQFLDVKKLIIEDQEILPSKTFSFTEENFNQIKILNIQITNIETKINWTIQNQKESATQNGWFTDAYNNLAKAKEAKRTYLETLK